MTLNSSLTHFIDCVHVCSLDFFVIVFVGSQLAIVSFSFVLVTSSCFAYVYNIHAISSSGQERMANANCNHHYIIKATRTDFCILIFLNYAIIFSNPHL